MASTLLLSRLWSADINSFLYRKTSWISWILRSSFLVKISLNCHLIKLHSISSLEGSLHPAVAVGRISEEEIPLSLADTRRWKVEAQIQHVIRDRAGPSPDESKSHASRAGTGRRLTNTNSYQLVTHTATVSLFSYSTSHQTPVFHRPGGPWPKATEKQVTPP